MTQQSPVHVSVMKLVNFYVKHMLHEYNNICDVKEEVYILVFEESVIRFLNVILL